MSLQIWLPLNGNLKNQGLNNVTVTNNGATVNANGKIGNCYSFDGVNNQYLELDTPLGPYYNNDFSWAVWLKPNSAKRGIILSEYAGTGSGNVALELTAALKIRVYWNGSPDIYTNDAIPINTWSHIAVTKTANQILFYINGTLIYTHNQPNGFSTRTSTCKARIGDDYRSGTVVDYDGSINDFRIYNHALSPKEVKEISKGLVCHYALDGGGALPNMLKSTPRSYNSSTYQAYQFNIPDNLVVGDTYTVQLWDVDVSHTGKTADQLNVSIYWGGGSNEQIRFYVPTGHADYLVGTFNARNASRPEDASNAWFNVYNSVYNADGTRYMHIGKWKLEKGRVATPWTPNEEDTDYGVFNFGDTKIKDVSGYGNDMTKVGDVTYETDTTRYGLSTHFINGQYLVSNENAPNFLPTDAITVNVWVKFTTWGNPISCTEGGGFNFENNSGIQFPLYINGVGYKVANSGVAPSTLSGGWHMLTGTCDRTNVKIYIDGVLKATTATSSTNLFKYANVKLYLSAEASGSGPASSSMVGNISDARIYATALSEADIKELYNIPVTIANNGSMLTQGLFVENNSLDIRNTGAVDTANIVEDELFNGNLSLGQQVNENISVNNIRIKTDKTGRLVSKKTFTPIDASYIEAHAGETLIMSYEVSALGDRYSTEQGQTAYSYTRYGIHGSMSGVNASGTSQTVYPFASYLEYSGGVTRVSMSWTIPSGWQTYGPLNFAIQDFDKPASTNNNVWFIRNVKLELSNRATPYISSMQGAGGDYIETQEIIEI